MTSPTQDKEELKQLAARKAVEFVEDGMTVGLGTGTTAKYAVDFVAERLQEGSLRDIVGIPTSERTEVQASSLGIPLATLNERPELDLAIDGADEVDPELNLVKGRGGALLREKMVEEMARRFVVITDDSKLVEGLGVTGAMPVEVVRFCWVHNRKRLEQLGGEVKRRMDGEEPFITDNGNYILDCYLEDPLKDPYQAAEFISGLTGVVAHGLFLGMADVVVVAGRGGVTLKEAGRT